MVNAWSLAYEELYGDMDKEYPIMNTSVNGDESEILSVDFPTGNVYGADTVSFDWGGGEDLISFDTASADIGVGYSISGGGEDLLDFNFKPQPDLTYKPQKYGEDKGIRDLKDYVSSTYQGHYTNDNSDVQTLDLIHSVGDAESFCRSNALKYLSRYDKKGQAKRDILKAMHYCLLLYYFSGSTNDEITTRGYETF